MKTFWASTCLWGLGVSDSLALATLSAGLLAMTTCSTTADVTLRAGDVFTCEFTSMQLESQVQIGGPIYGYSFWSWQFDTNSFEAGVDIVRVELFEDSTNTAPFWSNLVDIAEGGGISGSEIHWADYQGVMRVTVSSGEVVLRESSFATAIPRWDGSVPPVGAFILDTYRTTLLPALLPDPRLFMHLSSDGAVLSWPAAYTNWVPEIAAELGPDATWTAVTNAPTLIGATLQVTNNATGPAQFYRLRQTP